MGDEVEPRREYIERHAKDGQTSRCVGDRLWSMEKKR